MKTILLEGPSIGLLIEALCIRFVIGEDPLTLIATRKTVLT